MSSTTHKHATTSAQSGSDWSSLGNVFADDTSYAEATATTDTTPTGYLYLRGYGFDIPTTATVISARLTYACQAKLLGDTGSHFSGFWVAPVDGTTTLSADVGSVQTGGSIQVISRTLPATGMTPAVVNSSNFGMRFYGRMPTGTGTNRYLFDYCTVKLIYTVGDLVYTAERTFDNIVAAGGWTNLTNAKVVDSLYATQWAYAGSPTGTANIDTFGFNIPNDAIIENIRVFTTGATGLEGRLRNITNPISYKIFPADPIVSLTDASTFWSSTAAEITPAQVNSSSFGLDFYGQGDLEFGEDDIFHQVDSIRIQIGYYLEAPTGNSLSWMGP